jgi:hypothetical protein
MAPVTRPIPLRAHQVLCLQGFRGLGYSAAFVEEMAAVQATLRADPARLVRLAAEPDVLCAACPNLREAGCSLGGPDHEAHMRRHDRAVLAVLGVREGQVLAWAEVLDRVRRSVRGADLPALCTSCPWLPLGVCAQALEALRASGEGEAPVPAPRQR